MGELEVHVATASMPLSFVTKRKTTGQQLFCKVAGFLGLRETRFFGLQFEDRKGTSAWLGASETLDSHRLRKESPLTLQFMVRFWPSDVSQQVRDHNTLVLLFGQLQSAVESGELCCPFTTAAQLAALAAQVRYGDWDGSHQQKEHAVPPAPAGPGASPGGSLHPEALAAWQMKVTCLHRGLRGRTQRQALAEYFRQVQELPTYGVTYFEVTSELGTNLWLGVTARGLGLYEDKLTPKISFPWSSMRAIKHDGHKFIIKRACAERKKLVFYTSREQACVNIMLLTSGYNQLGLHRRRPRPGGVAEVMGYQPCAQGSSISIRNSTGSRPASGSTNSTDSSPASPRGDEERRSLPRSEATVSSDSLASAPREEVVFGSSGGSMFFAALYDAAAASAGDDDDDGDGSGDQRLTGAVAQTSGRRNPRRALVGDVVDDTDGSSAESNCGGEIRFNVSDAELHVSEAKGACEQCSNRLEASLQLSDLEYWGPFLQSLMAPD